MPNRYHTCARDVGQCVGKKKGVKGYHKCASDANCKKPEREKLRKISESIRVREDRKKRLAGNLRELSHTMVDSDKLTDAQKKAKRAQNRNKEKRSTKAYEVYKVKQGEALARLDTLGKMLDDIDDGFETDILKKLPAKYKTRKIPTSYRRDTKKELLGVVQDLDMEDIDKDELEGRIEGILKRANRKDKEVKRFNKIRAKAQAKAATKPKPKTTTKAKPKTTTKPKAKPKPKTKPKAKPKAKPKTKK